MFGASLREKNKENCPCQCSSDLGSPVEFQLLERKREELVTSFKEGQASCRHHRGSLDFVSFAAEFLLFSLAEVLGSSVWVGQRCRGAWTLKGLAFKQRSYKRLKITNCCHSPPPVGGAWQ